MSVSDNDTLFPNKNVTRYRTGGPTTILHTLYIHILESLGIGASRFDLLLRNYIHKYNKKDDLSLRDDSSLRGNLRKELLDPKGMSWNVFVKGLIMLNIDSVKLSFTLYRSNDTTSVHETNMKLLEVTPTKVLHDLYYQIKKELAIDDVEFDKLLRNYVRKSHKGVTSKRDTSSARGNLKKELSNEKGMSWNVFIKGLTLLNVVDFNMELHMWHLIKRTTVHSIKVQLDYDAS